MSRNRMSRCIFRKLTPEQQHLADLLIKQKSKDEYERATASAELNRMDPQLKKEQLLQLYAAEKSHRRNLFNRLMIVYCCFFIFMLIMSVVAHSSGMLGSMGGMMGGLAALLAISQTQKSAVQELAIADDVRIIPLLLDCLNSRDRSMHGLALQRLPKLLVMLKASDFDMLSRSDRKILLDKLNAHKHVTLTVAILKALEQIGDESFLPTVLRYADISRIDINPEIRQAALECLPFLSAKIQEQASRQTLLRASSAADFTPVDELLRPVTGSISTTAPEELLRPGPVQEQEVTLKQADQEKEQVIINYNH